MKIEVFELSCCSSGNLYDLVLRAAAESGGNAQVTKISDTMEAIK